MGPVMINDIVDSFKNYKPQPGQTFKKTEQVEIVDEKGNNLNVGNMMIGENNIQYGTCYSPPLEVSD